MSQYCTRAICILVICLFTDRAYAAAQGLRTVTSVPGNTHRTFNYSQAGVNLGAIVIPESPDGYDQPHDIVVDKAGNLQLFYGGPELATYNGSSWTFRKALNWGLFGVTYAGAIASYENYVYAQSQSSGGVLNGIIRFDTANNYASSIYKIPNPSGGHFEPQDVTMGMDGWLYVNVYAGGINGHRVYQLNPFTMEVSKYVQLTYGDRDGDHTVVDAQGNLYAMGYGYLNKYSATGVWLKSITLDGHGDLDISSDGQLLTMQGNQAIILDTDLNIQTFFTTQSAYWGSPFVSWDTYQAPLFTVPEPNAALLVMAAAMPMLARRRPANAGNASIDT